MKQDSKVIGIDLGTTNSVVAHIEGGMPVVISNTEGRNKTPSVVAFLDGGEVVVGDIAKRQAATNPKRTIDSVKRLMGRTFEDVEEANDVFSYDLVNQDGRLLIDIDGLGYRPEQISALVLKKLKESAEGYLGEEVTQAIITVPAYFDDLQRNATIEAANMAGLDVLRLINEPTAAALAYGLGKEEDEVIAVYDFGGGTFDISILQVAKKAVEVLTSTGNSHLGGDDLDNVIVRMVIEEFANQHQVDLTQDPVTLRRLKEVAEKAKCDLSSMPETTLSLPFIAYSGKTPLHLERPLTRKEFEERIAGYVKETVICCERALEEAGVSRQDIAKVILVGGSTRIPLVQEAVEDFFELTPFKGVNPDEIVALGAATQAGVFEGNIQEIVLLDVTPHSLGIEVKDGRFSTIIEKNSTVPIKAAKTFTTTEDNQTFVNIHVLQGESENAADNRSLGKFALADIPSAKSGTPRIRVTFFINADGVMEITATELGTGKEKSLTIVHSQLSEEEASSRRRKRSRRRERPSLTARGLGIAAKDTPEKRRRETAPEGVGIRGGEERPTPTPAGQPEPGAPMFRMVGESESSPHEPVSTSRPLFDATRGKEKELFPEAEVPGVRVREARPAPPQAAGRTLSTAARNIWPYIEARREDLEAQRAIHDNLRTLQGDVQRNPGNLDNALALAYSHILLGQSEEARQLLNSLEPHTSPQGAENLLTAYSELAHRFPSLPQIRRDRALLLEKLGRTDEAIRNIEEAHARDENPGNLPILERLYRAKGDDSGAQFKLVKILLKGNRLDDAIEILRQLAAHESFKARATKILGLCYWQKGEFQEAWQYFRQLPLSEEIRDIVYRLGIDMEGGGLLDPARQVYERILAEDPKYRDTLSRLKKIQFRLQMQQEEKKSLAAPPGLEDSRFTILEEINRGSMGIIFKARDKILDEIVVLKVLNDYLCSDPAAVERFKREARAAKRLSHPHIVRIHDMFQNKQKLFLSMEYIDGTDLKRILSDENSLSEDRILHYFFQICDALGYAHRLGIVHRDIKPANIMITKNNAVKITDFGIAKILRSEDATKSGTAIIGTPLYMAPEQITGEQVTLASDIYSLGIMLYELVAGTPPFYLGNIEYHHLHTAPPPLPSHVSSRLGRIIMKCIEKNPKQRYARIEDVLVDLRKGETSAPSGSKSDSSKSDSKPDSKSDAKSASKSE